MHKKLSDDSRPSKSWEILAYARRLLSIHSLVEILGRSKQQVNKYCINPRIHEDAHPNHIDRVANLLGELVEFGDDEGREVARTALNIMGNQCGFKVVNINPAEPTADDPRAEFLQILKAVNALQLSAERKDGPLIIESYKAALHKAVDSFAVHYSREFEEKGGQVHFSKTMSPESVPFWKRAWMKIQGISL